MKYTLNLSWLSILGIVFITLKLCDKIDWNWTWVLSPFWIPLALVLLGIIIAGIAMLIASMFSKVSCKVRIHNHWR